MTMETQGPEAFERVKMRSRAVGLLKGSIRVELSLGSHAPIRTCIKSRRANMRTIRVDLDRLFCDPVMMNLYLLGERH